MRKNDRKKEGCRNARRLHPMRLGVLTNHGLIHCDNINIQIKLKVSNFHYKHGANEETPLP